LSREDPKLEILTPEQLTAHLTNKDSVHIAEFNDELWNNIQQAREAHQLVLCMGAGEIDKWAREQLAQ
jgi:UDP-N-acetylmuramate-alanine ligase